MEELQIKDNSFNKGLKKEKKLNDYEINNKLSSIKNKRIFEIKQFAKLYNKEPEGDDIITSTRRSKNDILRKIDLIYKKLYKKPKISINKNLKKINKSNDYRYEASKINFYLGNKNDLINKNNYLNQITTYKNYKIFKKNVNSINNLNFSNEEKSVYLNNNKKPKYNNNISSNNLKIKKFNFWDYSTNERKIKNPQIYILTRTTKKLPIKYKLPSVKTTLRIKSNNNLNELIPDYNESSKFLRQKDFYEYYTNLKKNKKQKFIF